MTEEEKKAIQKLVIALGTMYEDVERMVDSVISRRIDVIQAAQELNDYVMKGLADESSKKTKQVVMFDNGSRNGPPPARGRGSQRGRS